MPRRPVIHTEIPLLDGPLSAVPCGCAMALRMAHALIEDGALSDRAAAVRCLSRRCYLAADIARTVDEARATASAVMRLAASGPAHEDDRPCGGRH